MIRGSVLLDALVSRQLELALFSNNVRPEPAHQAWDYREPQDGGYRRAFLSGRSWEITQVGITAEAAHPDVFFSLEGKFAPVYGYFILAAGVLVGAERFATPFTAENDLGATVQITPRITCTDQA